MQVPHRGTSCDWYRAQAGDAVAHQRPKRDGRRGWHEMVLAPLLLKDLGKHLKVYQSWEVQEMGDDFHGLRAA